MERNRLLQEQAEINPLTGLPNRQRCTQDLQRLLHLANQYQQCFCLGVLKIDDLQKINRNYGHQWGDKMLRRLGCLLQKELRSEDIVSYWNGGEFVVGMYGMSRGYGVEWLAEVLEMLRLIEFEVAQETFTLLLVLVLPNILRMEGIYKHFFKARLQQWKKQKNLVVIAF